MFDGLIDINSVITFFALAGAIFPIFLFIYFFYSIFKEQKAYLIPGNQIL